METTASTSASQTPAEPEYPQARTPKRKAGNPNFKPFEPTAEQRVLVEAMTGYGIPQQDIVTLIINPKTGKPINEVTLRDHFRPEINRGLAAANTKVVGALFKNATTPTPTYPGGIPTAQIFWLKARLGWKDGSGPGDNTPPPQGANEVSLRDTARRVAFLLYSGARDKAKPKPVKKLPA